MTVVDTTTTANATAASSQRKVDRCQNGVLWTGERSNDILEFEFSTDDGATFTKDVTNVDVTGAGARTFSFKIDESDFAHLVYSLNDDILYRRGTPNAGRTAWTWSAATTVAVGTTYDFPDVVAHAEGTGWRAHVVYSEVTGAGSNRALYNMVTITSGGVVSVGAQVQLGIGGGGVASYPSIDFHHTGDAKTVQGGTPHLFVSWSNGTTGAGQGIRFKKAAYAAGSWTWGAEREIDPNVYISSEHRWLNCQFDGTAVIIAGFLFTGSANASKLWERDVADTTTTLLADPGNTGMNYGAMTYDAHRNLHMVGYNGGSLRHDRWDRAANSRTLVVLYPITSTAPYVSVKRGHSGNLLEFTYLNGASSPFSVTYDSIALNAAPNAPLNLTPDGIPIDKDIAQRFSWTRSDPDVGDSQSKYDLRYRVVGAPSWTTLTVSTTNEFHDFAGGTFAAGDYEWQVRTYDAAGVIGPYSASAFFTAAVSPTGHAITDPINGGTISTANHTVVWSAPEQDVYQLRVVADDGAGNPDTATIYTDTGPVFSSGARSRSTPFETNNVTAHIQVRVQVDGLWSEWASNVVTVDYAQPGTPTLAVQEDTPTGAITMQASHPTPVGSEPTVTSVDFEVRVADLPGARGDGERPVGGDGIRIAAERAPSLPWVDWAVASGVEYEYRARGRGDNGTSSYSEWTSAGDGEIVEILDGGEF